MACVSRGHNGPTVNVLLWVFFRLALATMEASGGTSNGSTRSRAMSVCTILLRIQAKTVSLNFPRGVYWSIIILQCLDPTHWFNPLSVTSSRSRLGRRAKSMSAKRIYFSIVSLRSGFAEPDRDSCATVNIVIRNILPVLDCDRVKLCQVLMQMALSDDTSASKAVLQSMLALASLHRDGDQADAARLKLSALHTLLASTKHGIDAKAGIPHIAAELLLCAFEVSVETLI